MSIGDGDSLAYTNGMTLRDWFAGQALAGLGRAWLNGGADDTMLAQFSYQVADAMLGARQ
jgi:hypothetical protein